LLHNTDPVTAFGAAPLMLQRSAIAALMTVSLLPAPRGRKTFDPETVKINWKTFG
jgi:site-specific DNA recombinase